MFKNKAFLVTALILSVFLAGQASAGVADATPPEVSLTLDGGAQYNNTGTVSAVVEATDPESGIIVCEIDWADGSAEEVTPGLVNHGYSNDGTYTVSLVCFNGESLANSIETEITVDTVAPAGTDIDFVGGPISNSTDVSVVLTRGTDDGSGLNTCVMDWADGTPEEEILADGPVVHSFPGDGLYPTFLICYDNAGNYSSAEESIEVSVPVEPTDTMPPTGLSLELDGGAAQNNTGLVMANFSSGTDDTEIQYCEIRLSTQDWGDNGTLDPMDTEYIFGPLEEGTYTAEYRCRDVYNNISEPVSDSIEVVLSEPVDDTPEPEIPPVVTPPTSTSGGGGGGGTRGGGGFVGQPVPPVTGQVLGAFTGDVDLGELFAKLLIALRNRSSRPAIAQVRGAFTPNLQLLNTLQQLTTILNRSR
ncbi:PKD domain-containing protein [Candidatus Nomurabacteria bacterium]|nr:PKD domain-containing protein [Candidatus Nomurabacteria bacterium]